MCRSRTVQHCTAHSWHNCSTRSTIAAIVTEHTNLGILRDIQPFIARVCLTQTERNRKPKSTALTLAAVYIDFAAHQLDQTA